MPLPLSAKNKQQEINSRAVGTRRYIPMDAAGVLEAYMNDAPWLRSIVSTIASSVAIVKLEVFASTQKADGAMRKGQFFSSLSPAERGQLVRFAVLNELVEPAPDHPLAQLLAGGQSELTAFSLMFVTQCMQELMGEAYWYLSVNKLGVPVSATPISPLSVIGLPGQVDPSGKKLDGYMISLGKNDAIIVPPNRILRFFWPSPAFPLGRTTGIGYVLRTEIDADRYASIMVRNRFINNAVPPSIIFFPDVAQQELDEIRSRWLNEATSLWRNSVPMLFNNEGNVYEFSSNFQSLQFVELRQRQREIFIEAFGIPPEIIGHLENANRSTITAAERLYKRIRIVPRIEANVAVINKFLVPQYDDKLFIHYSSPLDDENEFALRAASFMPSTVTIDEWRTKFQGLPPLGKERGGDKFPAK